MMLEQYMALFVFITYGTKTTSFDLSLGFAALDHDFMSILPNPTPCLANTLQVYFNLVIMLNVSLFCLRLCGKVPFQSDSAAKLEELILEGELKFTELEWINTSQGGERRYTHTPVALQGRQTVTVHNYSLTGVWAIV